MNAFTHHKWHDPREKIWGFHVHQELPKSDFAKALVIQDECAKFLNAHQVKIDKEDAIKPGYGPHYNYMWELRIENDNSDVLEKMGLAISFMTINRFGLSAYIHPLMHNQRLAPEAGLLDEAHTNQANILWFSRRIEQDQTFFINPPKNELGALIDTRSSRVFSRHEKDELFRVGKTKMYDTQFHDPYTKIKYGFHIHMDFSNEESELALLIFDKFMFFLIQNDLLPTSTRIYGRNENGPHLQSGWEVKFETREATILRQIGLALGWLMCNRQKMPVFVHPVTWLPGDRKEELHAHENYAMFIEKLPPLDLNFFREQSYEYMA